MNRCGFGLIGIGDPTTTSCPRRTPSLGVPSLRACHRRRSRFRCGLLLARSELEASRSHLRVAAGSGPRFRRVAAQDLGPELLWLSGPAGHRFRRSHCPVGQGVSEDTSARTKYRASVAPSGKEISFFQALGKSLE